MLFRDKHRAPTVFLWSRCRDQPVTLFIRTAWKKRQPDVFLYVFDDIEQILNLKIALWLSWIPLLSVKVISIICRSFRFSIVSKICFYMVCSMNYAIPDKSFLSMFHFFGNNLFGTWVLLFEANGQDFRPIFKEWYDEQKRLHVQKPNLYLKNKIRKCWVLCSKLVLKISSFCSAKNDNECLTLRACSRLNFYGGIL